ncbi:MAG TPA: tetratricopeptide repeat protein [Burkholderiaceae bacterium]|nr:tetratricopeptide repeat protein [Burkholderiaceae bacterium]
MALKGPQGMAEREHTATFERAKALFLEGVEHIESGDAAAAEACFEASLALVPERASTLLNLGVVRVQLGKLEQALTALERSIALDASQPDVWCHRGIAAAKLGRVADAIASFERALVLDESLQPALFQLGCALNAARQHARALGVFERLLALAADNAAAWFRHGQTLQALGRPADAMQSYERALQLNPAQPQAWLNRGGLLREAGRDADAAAAYRQALAHGGDPAMIEFCLAAVEHRAPPRTPPRHHVEGLFDDYAHEFDTHLLQVLHYCGHEVLADELRRAARGRRFARALDLGCGTGLCGGLLQALAERIDGVDLAANMLAIARSRGMYDQLVHADVASYLAGTERRYGVIAAADVFTYVGDLDAVFAGAARVLDAGGLFGFAAEAADDDGQDFVLHGSLRYAHTRRYIESLARRHGFAVLSLARKPFREDQRRMIDAWYGVLSH